MNSRKDRASRKLKERNFKLNTLLEVSSAINNRESDEVLFNHFQNILTEKLSLGKGMLVSDINGWDINLEFGKVDKIDLDELIDRCFAFKRITVLNDHPDPFISQFDVMIPINHNSKIISYLMLGDFEGEKIEVSPIIRHLPFIQTLTNLIVVAQENKRLFDVSIERAALKKEMELASQMQKMLIPAQVPNRDDIELFALYKPHQAIGGDYYDFFQISQDETLFCMADISGKGVSAALLMSNFQAMMRAMMEYDRDLSKLVESLNQRVNSNAKGEKFITAFLGIYNHVNRQFEYINAGHQPALYHNGEEVMELSDGSTVLGAFEKLPHLNVGKFNVEPGSTLICFTDGVCEIENEAGDEFGTTPIKKLMSDQKTKSVEGLVSNIMTDIDAFKGSVPYIDDMALLGVRFQ